MSLDEQPGLRSHLTLGLCTVLHAFTHAYGTLLVPLYLLMQGDLKLRGVGYASFIVTIYGLVTCIFSYPAGILADRFNRKALLGIGLLGNAIAISAMALTHNYHLLILFGVLAGLSGTLFHPAANALIPEHYPRNPGMAIGLLGIGSGIGFYAGPQFAGWRAESGHWMFANVSNWQRPLLEAGVAGLLVGILFLFVAREVRGRHKRMAYESTASNNGSAPVTPSAENVREAGSTVQALTGRQLGMKVSLLAAVIGCRDFAGLATLSLASIYLQKAHHLDARRTGFILGSMMLVSIFINPVAVWLSPGRRRLPTLATIMILAGIVVATTPLWPVTTVLYALCLFMTFQLGSYAVSDAAILERVPSHVRGRVVGIFLTIAGTFSATSPWVMGFWTDRLGARAYTVEAYFPIFITLGFLMMIAATSMPLIAALGVPVNGAIDPMMETSPATMEPVV
jgi:FSR family fosmidomycin resistance protein-like MFS transporter